MYGNDGLDAHACSVCVRVCVCVRECVRACVRACVRVRVRVRVWGGGVGCGGGD